MAGFEEIGDVEAFLDAFGNETVEAKPGYAEAGGQYCAVGVACRVKRSLELRDLSRRWDGAMKGWYVSQFACGTLCERAVHLFGVPSLFEGLAVRTMNLLVGARGSGLPFHYHQKTWQALSFGRKAFVSTPSCVTVISFCHSSGKVPA